MGRNLNDLPKAKENILFGVYDNKNKGKRV
jgi:hypothetical protein